MALQTSGAISIGSLRGEFGDTGSSSLSEFYRGGSRVVSSVYILYNHNRIPNYIPVADQYRK